MTTSVDTTLPVGPPNVVELTARDDSKIVDVSVYSGRAEIQRLFKFTVSAGHNKVNISGLPNVLEQESLRVEGRGSATIHDVSISDMPVTQDISTSPKLEELLAKECRTEKALSRCKRAISALDSYMKTLAVKHVVAADLETVTRNFDAVAETLDQKILSLEEEIRDIKDAIDVERKTFKKPHEDDALKITASIGIFADQGGEVEMGLIYAVNNASWHAAYDIQVKMDASDQPVTLIYKAAILQNTGEDWEDVTLALETAAPTFGVGIPTLSPWTLSQKRYTATFSKSVHSKKRKERSAYGGEMYDPAIEDDESDVAYCFSEAPPGGFIQPQMAKRELVVSSKGNITATFQVPGLISIPTDNESHNVTIAKLKLDATMSWVAVPKKEAKAHLTAKIQNTSQYTFLSGPASVYVDGSFISRSDVPAVSPQESFDCPLGVDPTIRITYLPRVKKINRSAFSKYVNHSFYQRITIVNTKSIAIERLKIIDQFPISEDIMISVAFANPALIIPTPNKKGEIEAPKLLNVGDGVVAQWAGADEPDVDLEALGKNGQFEWICSMPSQKKLNLNVAWEVNFPQRSDISGLDWA